MSRRTSSQRPQRVNTAHRPTACSVESLEGRQLFSAGPLGGGVGPTPGDAGHGGGVTIAMRKAGGKAETRSIIGVLGSAPVQSDDRSIIAILRSLAHDGPTAPAVKIIAV